MLSKNMEIADRSIGWDDLTKGFGQEFRFCEDKLTTILDQNPVLLRDI